MTSKKFKWTPIDSVGIVVCLLLTGVAGWAGVRPIWQQHAQFLQQQKQIQSRREDNSRMGKALKIAHAHLSRAKDELSQIPLHLEPANKLNNRLASMTDLAARSKIKIEDIQPGRSTHGARYDTVDIRLAGEGAYSSCAYFIHQLKHAMPDVGIDSLNLTAGSGQTDQTKFEMQLEWFAAPSLNVVAAK